MYSGPPITVSRFRVTQLSRVGRPLAEDPSNERPKSSKLLTEPPATNTNQQQ